MERGDIVLLTHPKKGSITLVKRVVALEGDVITPLTKRSGSSWWTCVQCCGAGAALCGLEPEPWRKEAAPAPAGAAAPWSSGL